MKNFEVQSFSDDTDSQMGEGAPLVFIHTETDNKEDLESLHQYLDSISEE